MGLPSNSRNGQHVRLVVLHTAEGARTNASLYAYFDRTQAASCHAGIDENGVSDGWVPYDRAAWTLRNGNPYSDNAEICGFASWSREEWLKHPGMLAGAAAWVRARCLARGIPIVKLSPAEVRAGKAGVCGHVDYTQATGDGTHWDPGPGFPWDLVISAAKGSGGGGSSPGADQEEDDMAVQGASGIGQLSIPVNGKRGLFCLVGGNGADGKPNVVKGHVYYIKDTPSGTALGAYAGDREVQFDKDRPGPVLLPEGVRGVTLFYSATAPFTAWAD